jgi:hypothetical protein
LGRKGVRLVIVVGGLFLDRLSHIGIEPDLEEIGPGFEFLLMGDAVPGPYDLHTPGTDRSALIALAVVMGEGAAQDEGNDIEDLVGMFADHTSLIAIGVSPVKKFGKTSHFPHLMGKADRLVLLDAVVIEAAAGLFVEFAGCDGHR